VTTCPVCDKQLGPTSATCSACGTDLSFLKEMEQLPQTLLANAEIAEENGDDTTALSYYTIALEMSPNDPELIKKCAKLREKTGDKAGALRLWTKLKTESPQDSQASSRIETLTVSSQITIDENSQGRKKANVFFAAAIAVMLSLWAGWGGHKWVAEHRIQQPDKPSLIASLPKEPHKETLLDTVAVPQKKGTAEIIQSSQPPALPPANGKGKANNHAPETLDSKHQARNTEETRNRLTALSDRISRTLPDTISIESHNDGLKLAGSVDYTWEKYAIEVSAKSWDCGFVDLRQVAIKNPRAFHYRIRKGDTLFDLCKRFANQGSLCPKIYELNRHIIIDPNRLNTGDTIILCTDNEL